MKFATMAAVFAMLGFGMAETVPDLSKADEATFKANIGKTVSIQGKLGDGKVGCSVWDGTRKVTFYVVPDVPPGGFVYPKTWMNLMGHQVRVTGELKFRGFDHSHDRPDRQSAMDHYFMVMQKTKLEKLTTPTHKAEPAGAGQPATRPESKSEGGDKPQPEAEGRSR